MDPSFRKMLSAKIHRATVTHADVDYEGSITVPPELLRAAGMVPYEAVCVWNVTRGTRLETYTIAGQNGSNFICANGAAAHLIHPGDKVILATYAFVSQQDSATHRPRLVFVDDQNQIVHTGPEVAGPQTAGPQTAESQAAGRKHNLPTNITDKIDSVDSGGDTKRHCH